jgi:formylmethanofuran dehydrogenase subunit E
LYYFGSKLLIIMDLKLHIFKRDDIVDYSQRHRFCFAVVYLSKSKSYPSNFVCMLPTQVKKSKNENIFEKIFKERSVEQANILLTDALKQVEDSEIRVEIERRLTLFKPKMISEIKCSSCGKLFYPRRVRRFKNNFCEECMKRKFGSRE